MSAVINILSRLANPISIAIKAIMDMIDFTFSSDLDVKSKELKDIMANPEDKKKYLDALQQLKENHDKEVKITLSTNEELILVQ